MNYLVSKKLDRSSDIKDVRNDKIGYLTVSFSNSNTGRINMFTHSNLVWKLKFERHLPAVNSTTAAFILEFMKFCI